MMAPLNVAFALMLFYSSDRHYTIDQLADIFDADRDTISIWLTNWEEHAFDGLSDARSSGATAKDLCQRGCDDSPRSSEASAAK